MHLTYRNVNEAFYGLVRGIHTGGISTTKTESRNGGVLQIQEPVTITYTHPTERVLFNAQRDANPAFHLFESMWMLAGRNDVAPVAYYAKNIANYSDDGETFNGAYGYRWRKHEHLTGDAPIRYKDVDQLDVLIEHLKATPNSRRAVLNMWNVEDDLMKIDEAKDVCCNLEVCFSIREAIPQDATIDVSKPVVEPLSTVKYLDMTVFNRSNDMIWGMLGANVVHFSFLQEYMACCLGVEVGVYNQISNNLHVYENNWKPKEWLDEDYVDYPTETSGSLLKNKEVWDKECKRFVEHFHTVDNHTVYKGLSLMDFEEDWFQFVAKPMSLAFICHKTRDYAKAYRHLYEIKSFDWQMAGDAWITKRRLNWEKKQQLFATRYSSVRA